MILSFFPEIGFIKYNLQEFWGFCYAKNIRDEMIPEINSVFCSGVKGGV
jgi:hypothetical protein